MYGNVTFLKDETIGWRPGGTMADAITVVQEIEWGEGRLSETERESRS